MSTHHVLNNPSFIEDLDNYSLSSREVASLWGVGKTFVNKHRQLRREQPVVSSGSAEPLWNPIQNAKPTIVNATKVIPAKKSEWKTAVVLPDPQIGFRKFDDDTLDPFHDEDAMNVALQIVHYEQGVSGVDQVVNLGDFLDLPSQGRFAQEATFANTTQLAIDYGHFFLAQQRACAPNAEIVLIEGNHDRRMQNFVEANALAAFGLKRAQRPDELPVMSLPFLLRLDELDVTYIDSYPAGKHWINDKLRAIHGNKVRSNGSTAAAYTNDMGHLSTIFGHTHRLEIQSRTTWDRLGKIRSMAISPGCLCRVDGAVPSVNGAIGPDGVPKEVFENWQQGVAVIKYKDSGEFFVDLVQIDEGRTVYQGVEFVAE
jgi:predicted phosphodiesterase